MNIERLFETLGKIIGDRENAEVKIKAVKRGDKREFVPPSK